jgi:hypothetical protein
MMHSTLKKIVPVFTFVLLALASFAQEKRFSLPLDDSPSLGPPDAPVTIVEFIDFQ